MYFVFDRRLSVPFCLDCIFVYIYRLLIPLYTSNVLFFSWFVIFKRLLDEILTLILTMSTVIRTQCLPKNHVVIILNNGRIFISENLNQTIQNLSGSTYDNLVILNELSLSLPVTLAKTRPLQCFFFNYFDFAIEMS